MCVCVCVYVARVRYIVGLDVSWVGADARGVVIHYVYPTFRLLGCEGMAIPLLLGGLNGRCHGAVISLVVTWKE